MWTKNSLCTGKTCHIIICGTLLCALLWIVDSILDVTIFQERTLLEQIFAPHPHKTLNFVQAAVVLFLLVAYADFLVRKRRDAESKLQVAVSTAQEERDRSDSILEAIGDAISIQDSSFRILYQNHTHKEMMGAHEGDFCYQAYAGRHNVCDDCLLVQAFREGGTHTREKLGRSLKGEVTVEITVSALRNRRGEIIAGIEAVRDISERKRSEEEIVRLNSDLRQQAEELKAANSDLEAFSYSVSHDLRTPLTRICCSAEALRSGYSDALDEAGKFFLDNLCSAGVQMDQIIEALLDLSRATRGDLMVNEVDLGELAWSIHLEFAHTWPLRRVEFEAPDGFMVRGDERLLRIALGNLIENAWKFTEQRETARIVVGGENREEGPVCFVADNGAGFDMSCADRLFKPFQRLHNIRDFPGTGIGLATVRRVVQRHGGRVWAEAVPGKGATFFFTLPGRAQDSQQAGSAAVSPVLMRN